MILNLIEFTSKLKWFQTAEQRLYRDGDRLLYYDKGMGWHSLDLQSQQVSKVPGFELELGGQTRIMDTVDGHLVYGEL